MYTDAMQEFVALLAPALVALGFYNHLHRNKLSTRRFASSYGIFALFINLCSYLVIIFIFGNDTVSFEGRSFIVYLVTSAIFAFILPFVVNLIENTVSIEVRKNAKK